MSNKYKERKLSYPTTFLYKRHQQLQQTKSDNNLSLSDDSLRNITRRFSNVSDTFSKKIQSWRMLNNTLSRQDVISSGKSMCGQFIRGRLKRCDVFHKKYGLQRIRSIVFKLSDNSDSTYSVLHQVALELEHMYPHIYSDILNQTLQSLNPPIAINEKSIRELFKTLCHEIVKKDITWAKVVAVYCVAGGLSVDCVKQGHPEFIHDILESFSEVLENELSEWIVLNGGWVSLVMHYNHKNPLNIRKIIIFVIVILFSLIFCIISILYYIR